MFWVGNYDRVGWISRVRSSLTVGIFVDGLNVDLPRDAISQPSSSLPPIARLE